MIFQNLRLLLILTLLISSTACSTFSAFGNRVQQLEIFAEPVERAPIPMQPPPAPVRLKDVQWYVVSEENFEGFKERLVDRQGLLVWYAITVADYESLSVNLQEIRRYIVQQQELIKYYEDAIANDTEDGNKINTQEP